MCKHLAGVSLTVAPILVQAGQLYSSGGLHTLTRDECSSVALNEEFLFFFNLLRRNTSNSIDTKSMKTQETQTPAAQHKISALLKQLRGNVCFPAGTGSPLPYSCLVCQVKFVICFRTIPQQARPALCVEKAYPRAQIATNNLHARRLMSNTKVGKDRDSHSGIPGRAYG